MAKKIKKITTFLVTENSKIKYTEVEYDINGNEVINTSYFNDESVETKILTKFNDKNLKIEEITYGQDDEFAEKSVFYWNENNKLAKQEIVYLDESKSVKTFERNSSDNSLVITLVDEEGELEEKEILKFNETGEIIEKVVFDETEKIIEKIENEYSDNLLIRQIEFGDNDKLAYDRRFKYDENKNLVKRITLNEKEEVIHSVSYTYDDFKRVVEQLINNNFILRFTFDDENRVNTEERLLTTGMIQYQKISKFNEENLLTEEEGTEGTKVFEYEYFPE